MYPFMHRPPVTGRDAAGLALIEYALLCFLIAVTCVLIVTSVGENTSGLYTTICRAVASAVTGAAGC